MQYLRTAGDVGFSDEAALEYRFRCFLSVLVLSVNDVVGGGAWARRRGGRCARTPSLISVLVPVWLRSGDMMVDGVFRDAVRPLGL